MIYRVLFKLLLQRIEPETAHVLAARTLRLATTTPGIRRLLRRLLEPRNPGLRVHALGRTFPSPLGVGAGMDKDATWFEALGSVGFGFVEVGTVTARPQAGNDRPRVFRLARDRALLNRMGSPNPGADMAAARLRRRTGETIVGVNIGKTASTPIDAAGDDYRASARRLAPCADYLTLNVSSPNTPGLREIQAVERLGALVADVRAELQDADLEVPLLIKIAPDLSDDEIDGICDLALALELDGIIGVNSTVDRAGLKAAPEIVASLGRGGLSGAPLKARALEVLQRLYARVGDNLVLISVGGIETPGDAWERIRAGATLVQAHTGFVYGGPLWPRRMNAGLARLLRNAGGSSVQDFVGVADGPARNDEDRSNSDASHLPAITAGRAPQ